MWGYDAALTIVPIKNQRVSFDTSSTVHTYTSYMPCDDIMQHLTLNVMIHALMIFSHEERCKVLGSS